MIMAFTFGNQTKPAFGAATSTASSGLGFGGFGSTATASSASTGFNFGSGTAQTSAPSTGFGGFGGLGSTTISTSAPTGLTTGFNFGAQTQPASGSTGFNFGTTSATQPAAGTTGFNFGTSTTASTGASSLFGGTAGFGGLQSNQQLLQQQQQQPNASSQLANMVTAVIRPQIYGDERDTIVAKWNQLQAFWGTGKGYFNQQGEVVEFKPDNPFCRFKAVGYNLIPGTSNADGLVAIMFNKKFEEITKVQQSVVDTMQKIVVEAVGRTVGVNKMTISVCVEGVKEVPDDKCQMLMYLQDRADTGITRRISATDASSLLNQSQSQQQLSSQLCVTNVLPWVGLSKEQLKVYLDAVPTGIDPLIWQQAKLDNPDPEKLIPVPMTGFSDLNNRLQLQEAETAIQQSRLEMITQEIASLQHRQSDMVAKIEKYKRRQLELGHRVLKVMAKQEISRKAGFAIQGEEEQLRVQLEAIQGELNAPTQFKGRLNELMSQLRMLNQLGQGQPSVSYHMTPAAQSEIKDHLKQQQQGIRHLIDIIKEDLDDLKLIEGEMGCTA